MRTAKVTRNTSETQIEISINLDGKGIGHFDTGVPFLEHMLDQIARHGLIDLDIKCCGDLHIDDHHTVEDIGIALGQAIKLESLSRVVLDLSGRPGLLFNVVFSRATIGRFDVDLISEFFQGLVNHAMMTLHIDNIRGINAHHQAETIFKAFGRALRMAIAYDERMTGVMPSTKGTLTA